MNRSTTISRCVVRIRVTAYGVCLLRLRPMNRSTTISRCVVRIRVTAHGVCLLRLRPMNRSTTITRCVIRIRVTAYGVCLLRLRPMNRPTTISRCVIRIRVTAYGVCLLRLRPMNRSTTITRCVIRIRVTAYGVCLLRLRPMNRSTTITRCVVRIGVTAYGVCLLLLLVSVHAQNAGEVLKGFGAFQDCQQDVIGEFPQGIFRHNIVSIVPQCFVVGFGRLFYVCHFCIVRHSAMNINPLCSSPWGNRARLWGIWTIGNTERGGLNQWVRVQVGLNHQAKGQIVS